MNKYMFLGTFNIKVNAFICDFQRIRGLRHHVFISVTLMLLVPSSSLPACTQSHKSIPKMI